jgi:hypothetical protein
MNAQLTRNNVICYLFVMDWSFSQKLFDLYHFDVVMKDGNKKSNHLTLYGSNMHFQNCPWKTSFKWTLEQLQPMFLMFPTWISNVLTPVKANYRCEAAIPNAITPNILRNIAIPNTNQYSIYISESLTYKPKTEPKVLEIPAAKQVHSWISVVAETQKLNLMK